MNDRLLELLDYVQKTAGQVGAAAADALDSAGQRANRLLSVGKLNVHLAELQREKDQMLQVVGGMIYATHTGTLTDSDALLEMLRQIDGVQEQITAATRQIEQLRAGAETAGICPICGAPAQADDLFCRECGKKL